MEVQQLIVLFLLGIFGITSALNFYVAAPSTFRLNTDEVVAIGIDGANDASVYVEIKDYPNKEKVIFQNTFKVKQVAPEMVKIKLDTAQFPANFLASPLSPKLVSLNVRVQNVQKETRIPITSQSGYMFIQSDKPIYTPLERASFRIIPLTEEGLPSSERFQFQIKNPDGIVVEEKYYGGRRKLQFYFATHPYSFPKYPKLGEWTAVAKYGNNLEQNASLTFELQEYVLPTFTVSIKAPDVILPDDQNIEVTVAATHSYGKKVKGIVSIRFGVIKEHSSDIIYFSTLKHPQALRDGASQTVVLTSKLKTHKDIGWFPSIQGSTFVVEATVVDDATGNKVVEFDSKGRFSKTPLLISFKQSLSDFKPGLISVFEADITFMDGRPAKDVPAKLTAKADNGKVLKISKSTSNSDANGKVSFEIHPELHHKSITLTLETALEGFGNNQAKGTHVQLAYKTSNGAYIAISRQSQSKLKPHDSFRRDIHLEPKGIQNIYYLVVARGRIQKFSKLHDGKFVLNKIVFTITHDMVPSFRVIVFAHHGKTLVADSLKIDVDKVCSPEAEVKLEAQFEEEEPGSGGKIIIRGHKYTSVGLFGVDKAVYAMSRTELVKKEQMFERLESHDLGCGPGGGLDINSVLGNAGIMLLTNNYTPLPSHSCNEVKRKKRSIAEDIVSKYTGKEKACCSLGIAQDKYGRICYDRHYSAEESFNAVHENCSEVFLECCLHAEENDIAVGVFFIPGRVLGVNFDGVKFLDPEKIDEFESLTTVRKEFKETWFNSDYIIGPNNITEVDISLPHSITTWIIQAVSVSPTHGICVAEPTTTVSFKKVFLHLNLPYSIKLYEQVEIQATVFNYGSNKLLAYVYMYETPGICSETGTDMKSEKKKLFIEGKSAETVTFSIVPLAIETFPIRFVAVSTEGSDVIEKKLHVVPRGIKESESAVIRLDPTNRQNRVVKETQEKLYSDSIDSSQNLQVTALNLSLPLGTVPGTVKCSIKAVGDFVGPVVETSLKNPDDLIQLPTGCGEQNMMRLAPTIYTMKYLQSANKLTPERRDRGYQFIRTGYSNELTFKKNDGSYSVWANTPTSTWLTAFVMKVFCQGTKFIPLDENVLTSGIQWLVRNQQADGSYVEKNIVYHRDMMGGVHGPVSMTAFALITLEECKNEKENLLLVRERAKSYLESQKNTVDTPLPAAIIAYALALSNSSEKTAANDKLLAMAKYDQNKNYIYWKTRHSAQDIETAGYALLTQLQLNDLNRATSIVNWLNTKQLKGGEFKSTQDTVIALQSLSEYAAKAPNTVVNLVSNLTSSINKTFNKIFRFNKDNALEPQEVTIENPEGMIFVKTSGTGVGSLTLDLEYNVIKPVEEICKFEIKETVTVVENFEPEIRNIINALGVEPERRRRRQVNGGKADNGGNIVHQDDKLALNINICTRYLGNSSTEMSIVDVGIFSGFEPIADDLIKLVLDPTHLIQKYEKSSKGIIFYLEKIPRTKDYCFSFRIFREYIVGNTQSSVIKVYDYYNTDAVCTKFYSPDGSSALIRTICRKEVCHCAEGGCPPKDGLVNVQKIEDAADRRDKMKEMFCEHYSYVWLGRLTGRLGRKEGYRVIPFHITEVIKEGAEGKTKIQGKIRNLSAHEYCETADIYAGATYLILGKDPTDGGEDIENVYFLDKNSLIIQWASEHNAPNKDLQRDLDKVRDILIEDGCG